MYYKKGLDYNVYFQKRVAICLVVGTLALFVFILIITSSTAGKELQELWGYLFFGITSISFTLAYKFYYQKGLLESINRKLLNMIDNCCNKLISVGAYDAFKLDVEGFPFLLREELYRFGNDLIKYFCDKDLFKNIDGGVFYLKSQNLPTHEVAIYPETIRQYYSTEFKEAMEYYVYHEKRSSSLIMTAKNNKIKSAKIMDKDPVTLYSKSGKPIDYSHLRLPSDYCTVTPVNINDQPLGYFALFYEKPPSITSWYQMEPLIDIFIIEKLENWKIDDIIKSMFEREMLLYTIFLIMRLDDFSNIINSVKNVSKKKEFVMNKIVEEFSKYLFSPVCYLHVEDEIYIHSKASHEETELIKNRLIPNIAQTFEKLTYDERQPRECDVATLGFDVNVKNKYIVFVPIKFKETTEDFTKEHYYGHFGLLRETEYNEFDLSMLAILEETKLDNIIKGLFH